MRDINMITWTAQISTNVKRLKSTWNLHVKERISIILFCEYIGHLELDQVYHLPVIAKGKEMLKNVNDDLNANFKLLLCFCTNFLYNLNDMHN
eukprot:UN11408